MKVISRWKCPKCERTELSPYAFGEKYHYWKAVKCTGKPSKDKFVNINDLKDWLETNKSPAEFISQGSMTEHKPKRYHLNKFMFEELLNRLEEMSND